MANIEENEENRLSPVLNNYKINRKLLQQKKLQRKSSRVKLTERFQSSLTVGDFTGSVSNIEKNESQTFSGQTVELSDSSKLPHDTQKSVVKCLQTVHSDLLDFGPDETDKLFENITIIENEMRDKLKADSCTVKVAESAIDNATKTFSEELSRIPDDNNDRLQIAKVVSFGGFQTASGKCFKLSEAALEIANKRFNEDLSVSDIKTDMEKSSKLSKLENIEHNKGCTGLDPKLQESLENPGKDINFSGRPSFGGFQTASGKGVKLSESAIEAAKKRFKEDFPKISTNQNDTVGGVKTDFGSSGKESNGDLTSTQFPLQSIQNKLPEKISKIDEKPGFSGFQTAAGKEVKLSQSAIDAARRQFNEDLPEISDTVDTAKTDFELPQKISKIDEKLDFSGFQTASGKGVKLSQSAIDAAKKRFNEDFSKNTQIANDDIKLLPSQTKIESDLNRVTIERKSDGEIRKFCEKSYGFQTASGREVKLSESTIEAANRRFNEDISETARCNNTQAGFSSASGKSLKLSESSLENARRKFSEEITKLPQSDSFQTASGKGLKLSKSAIEAAKKRFSEDFSVIHVKIDDKENFDSFKHPSVAAIDTVRKHLCEGLENCKDLLQIKASFHGFDYEEVLESQRYSMKLQEIFQETENNKRKCPFESRQLSKISKTANSVDIHTSSLTQSLNNTTDISTTQVNKSRKRLGMTIKPRPFKQEKLERAKMVFDDLSPIKTNQYAFNSTPIKMTIASEKERPVLFNTTITPIKSIEKTCKIVGESTKFRFQPHTGGNFDVWASNLQKQRVELENQLRIINARQEALDFQKNLFNNADRFYKQKRQGVLLSRKENAINRIPLKSLKIRTNGPERVPKITPQNAALIHFRNDAATIKTEDGALIIPNTNNLIGFTEISTAFKTMPGIEPKLLPRLWLENHYKWIVWKLASYENFVENGQDCLNIENIVQQLKYRYDREIDKAERPILRRILEKDDTPQKRMVLCVANINKLVDGKFELELTDGWYGIKTVIDDALSAQIVKERIKIGTKLMINNAELLNCDGCHPLETPDSVCLKITSNSTRRTLWHCKLGCYHVPEPFPITLRSIQPTGGLIGCVQVYIARIYPIRHLEKQGKLRVWRNQRAEERRAQEWENEKLKRIEQVQELVRKDYEKSLINSNKTPTKLIPNKCDIVGITCGKTLFELYETSKDPEQFQELLSESQRISMIEFQRNVSFYRQQEINNKIKENINKLDICQRDVAAVLKILVVDAIEENDKGIIFQIWKADEHHLQTLREGSVFRIYNVMPKANGDLSSTSKTRFKAESNDLERFKKFNRILTPISTLLQPTIKLNFNEFDTVGVIVELSINQYDQNFWLSDAKNCMVFVKIYENSKNCSLLENSKIGDIISICNLIYYERQYDFIHTIANHSTIISKYPQSKHLIDGIAKLNEELSIKDFDKFLVNCREKVSNNLDKISLLRNSKDSSKSLLTDANLLDASETLTEATEESTLTSRITSLDVAMSMIDIDKFT